MRKIVYGVLAVAIGAFVLFVWFRAPERPLGALLFGGVFLLGGLDLLLRRGPKSALRQRLEGVAALAIAGSGVYRLMQMPAGADSSYAQGARTGSYTMILVFGLFGLYQLFRTPDGS